MKSFNTSIDAVFLDLPVHRALSLTPSSVLTGSSFALQALWIRNQSFSEPSNVTPSPFLSFIAPSLFSSFRFHASNNQHIPVGYGVHHFELQLLFYHFDQVEVRALLECFQFQDW